MFVQIELCEPCSIEDMIPAPVQIIARYKFLEMDLSKVGYVISICESDEQGTVLRDDFEGKRLNLYFWDFTNGDGIATAGDMVNVDLFSKEWAKAAHADPSKSELVIHCHAGVSRSTATAMLPLIEYYGSIRMAAQRMYQVSDYADPNTHILHLISEQLALKENIYEILFKVQNRSIMLF